MSWLGIPLYQHRDLSFIGRDDLLARVHHRLQGHMAVPILALTGLSGIGKTRVVLEYASRYAHEYQGIVWVDASSRRMLKRSLHALLWLNTSVPEKQLFSVFREWLSALHNWLLVLDQLFDLNQLDLIIPHLPPSENKPYVLITTREQATGTDAGAISVDPLSNEASTLLLLRRAGLLPAEASLEQAFPVDALLASALAEKLDNVPLAVDQMGALLQETNGHLDEYLALSEHGLARILSTRGRMLDDLHTDSFGSTIEQIMRRLDPNARELLRLYACCFPNVPHELPEALPLWNRSLRALTDPLVFDEARAELLRSSLLSPHPRMGRVHLYGVVRTIVLSLLTPEQQRIYERLATSLFPK